MKLDKEHTLISIRIPMEIKEKLDYLSAHHWVGVSDVVRSGIRRELDANQELLNDKKIIPVNIPMNHSR